MAITAGQLIKLLEKVPSSTPVTVPAFFDDELLSSLKRIIVTKGRARRNANGNLFKRTKKAKDRTILVLHF